MTKITRYILKESITPFSVGTLFFTFLFIIDRIRTLVQLTMEKGTPIEVTLQLFLYMLPFTAAITIPMGVLFGILLAYGRLSSDSEIIAMKATGTSIHRIFIPAAIIGIASTILMFLFINFLVPVTNYRYKAIYKSILYSNPGIMMQSRVFTEVPNTDKKISTLGISEDGDIMQSVFIYEFDVAANAIKITYADSGEWLGNELNSPLIVLKLSNGRTMELNFTSYETIQDLKFNQLLINIDNNIKEYNPEENSKGLREISFIEIYKRIQENKRNNSYISSNYWIEFHKKFSIPIACLVFVIVAVPLAISFSRSGKGVSFVTAIIIIFIYYLFMNLGEILGRKEFISPQLSMWLPNIIVLLIGIVLYIRKSKE